MAVKGSNPIWHEVSLRFSADQTGAEEFLRQILYQLGFGDADISVLSERRYGYLKVYCRTKNEAHRLAIRLASLNLKKIQIIEKALRHQDWRDKWKDDIKPFRLTKDFDVVPSWNMKNYSPGRRKAIYLDTTLSFGTGLHETTRFMAQLIENHTGKFQTFLDIGTGTGLLAIVASKCGARVLWAVDIEAQSVETARKNLKRNGIKFDRCCCRNFKTFVLTQQFDFTAANVITDELIAMKTKIIAAVKPEKFLAVSGISLDNLARFQREFKDESLRCLKIVKGKKWAAVLYKKTRSVVCCR